MSRKIIILISVLSVVFIIGCFINTNINMYNSFDDFLRDPFRIDYETEHGYISLGAIKITDDYKFVIEKNNDDILCLDMYYKKYLHHELIRNITQYKKKKNKCYIKSDEGYAIVDSSLGKCSILITIPLNEYVIYSGLVDDNGNKIYNSRMVKDDDVIFLESFDDFTTEEQKCLIGLEE